MEEQPPDKVKIKDIYEIISSLKEWVAALTW